MPLLGRTALDVFPLCLGGNVFGWTLDDDQSFAVLDAYAAAGGNFIDTADAYSTWKDGNSGGESETIIGRWLTSRGNRDRMVIATKVAKLEARPGLSAANIRAAVEDSLRRLGTDYIDLYYAHEDDPTVPLEETLGAFDALVREGKVRHLGASNFAADRLDEALLVSEATGLARYEVLQPHYNLMERAYEGELRDVCVQRDVACVPYFALAMGFLTGKYRSSGTRVESVRAAAAAKYLEEGGEAVLSVLDELAASRETTVAAVALAWLAAQPTVAAPIASARTVEQLSALLPMTGISLTGDEIARLSAP
ncbi:MAG: aldo/keto reductase [Gaiellales bacterium]